MKHIRSAIASMSTLLTSFLMLMLPVSAAHAVIIPVEFNTASNESFTVAVLGEGNCVSSASPSACSYGIYFNCSAGSNGNCAWVNATGNGGAPTTQDPGTADQAILIATNTGTATLSLTMKAESDIHSDDSCLNMTMTHEQEASCTTTDTYDSATETLKTSDVTLDASFTPADDQICIWLWGNFTGCTAGVDSTNIYLNSTVA